MTNFVLDEPTIRCRVVQMTREQYRFMGESGLLQTNVELINGFIVKKMPKSPLHTLLVARFQAALAAFLLQDYSLRKEEPLLLNNSEPEPDIAIVLGLPERYALEHPSVKETLLVVEIAISPLQLDRKKAELYAEAGIACYWLVNGVEMNVEAYSLPQDGVYTDCTVFQRDDVVPVPFANGSVVRLSEIFPELGE